jgi:hypothetical protein
MISGVVQALSLKALNPFDTIERLQVEVFVGEAIGSASGERLFGDDRERKEYFRDQLERSVETLIQSCGLQVDSEADDYVGVGIWGHQVPRPGNQIDNVFLISITVTDIDWNPDAQEDCQRDLTQEVNAIGLATDDQLEQVLSSEVMRLLEEQLPKR